MMPEILGYLHIHGLELASAITAAFGIWFTTKRWLLCWPITLISIFLYMLVFFRVKLYSDALLQVFFVVFTFYGWWHWWRGVRQEGEVRIAPLALRRWWSPYSPDLPGGFS